jgi:Cu(I)/Ag(I) efflux system membrane protein CusA/SilA
VQAVVAGAVGGENIGKRSKGWRASRSTCATRGSGATRPERLQQLPILTPTGQQITLGSVARIASQDGPPMLKSENARPSGWVYVDVRGRDLASVAEDLRAR